jgi:hypothetical protein
VISTFKRHRASYGKKLKEVKSYETKTVRNVLLLRARRFADALMEAPKMRVAVSAVRTCFEMEG